jgi:hypothetical protein
MKRDRAQDPATLAGAENSQDPVTKAVSEGRCDTLQLVVRCP